MFVLERPITVLEAIARAHGLETGLVDRNVIDVADLQRSFLMRGGRRIALNFEKLFQEAKAFEPQFWGFDVSKATYLLPRWYGQPGEWEYALTLDLNRSNGLGLETYARVVNALSGYYENIFRESHASWSQTRDGFELIRQRYPDSLAILSEYCRLACSAEDRLSARKLFDELGGRMLKSTWRDQNNFRRRRNWAYSQ